MIDVHRAQNALTTGTAYMLITIVLASYIRK